MKRRMMAMRAGLAALGMLAGAMRAADDPNEAVAPFLDGQTLLVGHADVGAVDTAAIETYVGNMLTALKVDGVEEARQHVAQARAEMDATLARFKGLGGRHLFWVVNHGDIFPSLDPRAWLVPVPAEKAADMVAYLKEVSASEHGVTVEMLTPSVVFVGAPPALERLRAIKPAPRPELKLASGPEAPPVELVGAMTADLHRVFAEIVPALPPQLGGGTAEPLLAVKRISVQLRLPPRPSVTVRAFFEKEADARATASVAEKGRETILADREFNREMEQPEMKPIAGNVRELVKDVLTPAVAAAGGGEWEVRMALDDARLQQAARVIGPALSRARTQARRMQSMSNMRQVVMGVIIYANDHQGALPETLAPVAELSKLPEKVMVSPIDGKKYIYRRWVRSFKQISEAATTPLLWEDVPATADVISVGFADGHCELMRRAAFDKLLATTEAWAKQAEEKP